MYLNLILLCSPGLQGQQADLVILANKYMTPHQK